MIHFAKFCLQKHNHMSIKPKVGNKITSYHYRIYLSHWILCTKTKLCDEIHKIGQENTVDTYNDDDDDVDGDDDDNDVDVDGDVVMMVVMMMMITW